MGHGKKYMKHTVGVIDLPETNVISTVGVQVACIGIATRLVRSNATVQKVRTQKSVTGIHTTKMKRLSSKKED